MPKAVRVGVVGCGEVAQIIHLPTLCDLSDLFEVAALCDVSGAVLERVGAQWSSAERYADPHLLIDDRRVDAVLIANPHVYHTETALAAMRAGKHVLIEKPMCVNLVEADALLECERRSGVVAQVGFMRRYAPAFVEAAAKISAVRSEIILARVHDVIGGNSMIIDSTSKVFRDIDSAVALAAKLKGEMAAATELAIGARSAEIARAYGLLLGLASHDISAMRELLGRPERVLCATQRLSGRVITATLDFGRYVCQFETAVDQIPHFDAHIEVCTDTQVFRLDYDTPYIRHQPAKLSVTGRHGAAGLSQTSTFPSRYDSFAVEWREFHRNIVEGLRPKTSIADAREDLEIFRDMVALME
jgi:predicted dehydrogenase